MKSLKRRPTWSEDEVTAEVYLLGALIERPVVTVLEDAPISHLHEILVDDNVPAIAVVDPEHTLRGLVTRTDVLRALRSNAACAKDAMTSDVFVIPVESTVESAAALIAVENVGQIVVVGDDGDLLGIVSATDIARYVAKRAGYVA
jgi:IMP dehydrogenase